MFLLGFGFKAGVGKDTAGDYLVREYGWVKKSFAENLKKCCMSYFKLTQRRLKIKQNYDWH